MRCISSTSFFSASTSGPSPSIASSSLKRVRMVRRSCETPASMVVRCSIARSTRSFISMKATAARRTSRAPRGPEIRRVAALAEGFGGVGQAQDRADLVAQEDDGDGEQDERGADHPEQEDLGVRGVGRAARREHPHHRIVELDADLDQRRFADGVDPERPLDLAQFDRQAPGRAARRTASVPAAASRSRAGNRPRGRAAPARCAGSAHSARPADSRDRRRSAPRCRTPPTADSFCVTEFQCRSMNTKATTDCRITIGAMMMSSARA